MDDLQRLELLIQEREQAAARAAREECAQLVEKLRRELQRLDTTKGKVE